MLFNDEFYNLFFGKDDSWPEDATFLRVDDLNKLLAGCSLIGIQSFGFFPECQPGPDGLEAFFDDHKGQIFKVDIAINNGSKQPYLEAIVIKRNDPRFANTMIDCSGLTAENITKLREQLELLLIAQEHDLTEKKERSAGA